jgi:DNA-binding IscR family transcriptional regulator
MNSRFAVAVHILTLLEKSGGKPVTSERMAGSINTNASLVRRMLGTLAASGLTTSQMGTGGGALLARPASTISLADVYRAVQAGELFGLPNEQPNPMCPVGRNIQAALSTHFASGEWALEQQLSLSTIADVLHSVVTQEALRSQTGGPPA